MDFQFLQNPASKKWISLAPRRAKRPDAHKEARPTCPFCTGTEKNETELYRVGGQPGDETWQIRVIPNKFPFAPIHELIIHSPDHHKNFGELPVSQAQLIFETYQRRFNEHRGKGQVYIFHNRGEGAGESLPHPHTQLTVVPSEVILDIPPLDRHSGLSRIESNSTEDSGVADTPQNDNGVLETSSFLITCPSVSQWPDEVWIAAKASDTTFGDATSKEIIDLSEIMTKLIQIYDLRYGHEFPYNFYIYPGKNWYLRLIPRVKTLGGFEIGTGVFVNTQDPRESFAFLRDHFKGFCSEDGTCIHLADYRKHV